MHEADIELEGSGHRATLSRWGGSCRSLHIAGELVIDAGAGDERAQYRGAVLAPWPNRTSPTSWSLGEARGDLTPTPGLGDVALHGLVADCEWKVELRSPDAATLRTVVAPSRGYPFRLSVRAAYGLADGGLRADFEIRNESSVRAPVGVGWHPYFTTRAGMDDACLRMACARVLRPDPQGIPQSPVEDWATISEDEPLRLRGRRLDHSLELLEPASSTFIGLSEPGRDVTLTLGPGWRWLHVYTADTLPAPDTRGSVALEPATCPANALHTGEDLEWIGPGEAVALWVEVGVLRAET